MLKYALLPRRRYKPPAQLRQNFTARTEGRSLLNPQEQVHSERQSLLQVSRRYLNTAEPSPTLSLNPHLVSNRGDRAKGAVCTSVTRELPGES